MKEITGNVHNIRTSDCLTKAFGSGFGNFLHNRMIDDKRNSDNVISKRLSSN